MSIDDDCIHGTRPYNPTPRCQPHISTMKAVCVFDRRIVFGERDFAELVAWHVPEAVPPSPHRIKYRLAYIVEGVRVIGFDNEGGKGDHRHDDGVQSPYLFRDVDGLVADFIAAVQAWRRSHGRD